MSNEDKVSSKYDLFDTDNPEALLRLIFGGPPSGDSVSDIREGITTKLRSRNKCSLQSIADMTSSGEGHVTRQSKNFHGTLLAQFDEDEEKLTRTAVFEYLLEDLNNTLEEFDKIIKARRFLSQEVDDLDVYLNEVEKEDLDLIFGENAESRSGWEFWSQINWEIDWEDVQFNPDNIEHFDDYRISKAEPDRFSDVEEGFEIFREYLNRSDEVFRIAKTMNPITVKTHHDDGIIERLSSSDLSHVHNIVSAPGGGNYVLTDRGKRFAEEKIRPIGENDAQICVYDGEFPFSMTLFMNGEEPVANVLEVNQGGFGSEGDFILLHSEEMDIEWPKKFFWGYVESDYTTDLSGMDIDGIRNFLTSGGLRSSLDFVEN